MYLQIKQIIVFKNDRLRTSECHKKTQILTVKIFTTVPSDKEQI